MLVCCFCKDKKNTTKPLISFDEKCNNNETNNGESVGWKTYGELSPQEYNETINLANRLKQKYANLKRLVRDDESALSTGNPGKV
jgi:hypothetical protein